jgi:hypothetical protein
MTLQGLSCPNLSLDIDEESRKSTCQPLRFQDSTNSIKKNSGMLTVDP